MRTELANLNHIAVPFLSRADVNLCWYYITIYTMFRIVLTFWISSYMDFSTKIRND